MRIQQQSPLELCTVVQFAGWTYTANEFYKSMHITEYKARAGGESSVLLPEDSKLLLSILLGEYIVPGYTGKQCRYTAVVPTRCNTR